MVAIHGWPPSVNDFYLPGWAYPWITKFTVLIWIAVAAIIIFYLTAYRKPQIVPSRMQWIAESIYGFARNNVAGEMIGHEGIRFAPYLATLFSYLLVTNIFTIIPLIQISPNAHIAFPAVLAFISWIMFMYVGARKHGVGKYIKMSLVPPGVPGYMLPLIVPLEFLSTFILRPFTLALRLFANMFAGHVILLVFTLGGFVLLDSSQWFIKPISLVSWALAIALTFFEALIAVLQAYVFILLTSSYIQGSLAEEH